MKTQSTDLLWEEIERAERDLMQNGIEKIVAAQPYKLQLVLTGRLIQEFGKVRAQLANGNGNGNSKFDKIRRVAITISIPAITGAGIYAMLLELARTIGRS